MYCSPLELNFLGGLLSPCTRETNIFHAMSYIYARALMYHVYGSRATDYFAPVFRFVPYWTGRGNA